MHSFNKIFNIAHKQIVENFVKKMSRVKKDLILFEMTPSRRIRRRYICGLPFADISVC
jgi:hypothetical protein